MKNGFNKYSIATHFTQNQTDENFIVMAKMALAQVANEYEGNSKTFKADAWKLIHKIEKLNHLTK